MELLVGRRWRWPAGQAGPNALSDCVTPRPPPRPAPRPADRFAYHARASNCILAGQARLPQPVCHAVRPLMTSASKQLHAEPRESRGLALKFKHGEHSIFAHSQREGLPLGEATPLCQGVFFYFYFFSGVWRCDSANPRRPRHAHAARAARSSRAGQAMGQAMGQAGQGRAKAAPGIYGSSSSVSSRGQSSPWRS